MSKKIVLEKITASYFLIRCPKVLGGPEGGLEAVGDIDLLKNIVYMGLDRIGADKEIIWYGICWIVVDG